MSPSDTAAASKMFRELLEQLLLTFEDNLVRNELRNVEQMVSESRFHEAMKTLKSLYPLERRLLEDINTSFPFEDSQLLQAKVG